MILSTSIPESSDSEEMNSVKQSVGSTKIEFTLDLRQEHCWSVVIVPRDLNSCWFSDRSMCRSS